MTFRTYLAFMACATVLAWTSWFFVLSQIDPTQSGFLGFALFYTTLFLALVGTVTFLEMLYRILVKRPHLISREVRISFRHAVLLSFVAMISLGLAGQQKFTLSLFLPLVFIMSVIEYIFVLMEESRRT